MKEWYRWVLGDGQSINIHTDRWLREKENLCVDQDDNRRLGLDAKVCDFFGCKRHGMKAKSGTLSIMMILLPF